MRCETKCKNMYENKRATAETGTDLAALLHRANPCKAGWNTEALVSHHCLSAQKAKKYKKIIAMSLSRNHDLVTQDKTLL